MRKLIHSQYQRLSLIEICKERFTDPLKWLEYVREQIPHYEYQVSVIDEALAECEYLDETDKETQQSLITLDIMRNIAKRELNDWKQELVKILTL